MYLTLKQQVKHLSKKEFRNLKYLSHIAKNLTNEAIYNIRQYYFNKHIGKLVCRHGAKPCNKETELLGTLKASMTTT